MVTKICENCGASFEVIKSRENTARFCCRACADEFKRKNQDLNCTCDWCGKKFHLKPSAITRYKRTMGIYCSKECMNNAKVEFMKGENNHQYGLKGDLNASFKGKEIQRKNNTVVDIRVYDPTHPYADKNGRVLKHRLVIEENYQMFDSKYFDIIKNRHVLKKIYSIHHKDRDHTNNDITNLEILTRSEHTSEHNKEKQIIRDSKTGRITGVIKLGELLESPEEDNQQPNSESVNSTEEVQRLDSE